MNGEPGKGTEQEQKAKTQNNLSWWSRQKAGYRAWREDLRSRRNYSLFIKLVKDPRTGMQQVCTNHAVRLANAMMMNFLDQQRVSHCRFCAETAPLRRWGAAGADYLVCEHHFNGLAAGAFQAPMSASVNGTNP